LTAKLTWFEEQFRLSQQRRFCSSSEQTNTEQLNLFNEAEAEAKPSLAEPTFEEITYRRRKKEGHREALLEDLPELSVSTSSIPVLHAEIFALLQILFHSMNLKCVKLKK